jgi:hypothetical protein
VSLRQHSWIRVQSQIWNAGSVYDHSDIGRVEFPQSCLVEYRSTTCRLVEYDGTAKSWRVSDLTEWIKREGTKGLRCRSVRYKALSLMRNRSAQNCFDLVGTLRDAESTVARASCIEKAQGPQVLGQALPLSNLSDNQVNLTLPGIDAQGHIEVKTSPVPW